MRVENLQVVRHIFQHVLKICLNPFVLVLFHKRFCQIRRIVHEGLSVHLFDFFLDLFLQVSQFNKDLFNPFLKFTVIFLHGAKFISGEPALLNHGFNLVNVGRVSVHQRHHLRPFNLAHLNIHQGKPFFLDLFIEAFEKPFPPGLIGRHNVFFGVDIFLAFKDHGDLFF